VKRLRADSEATLLGIDQSATGTAFVLLNEGRVVNQVFWADSGKDAKRLNHVGALPPEPVKAGDERGRTARLARLDCALSTLLREARPAVAALEDYALARLAFAHHLGEVGAVVRLALWRARVPFRVYDVQAVKLFAAGRGDARKEDVLLAVARKWKVDWTSWGKPEGSAGNLADACAIAYLLRTELEVRSGRRALADLPEEERRVFLRVTKQHAVNLLDAEFAEDLPA
jgi:Holliday junction resolvasome RuvABC endonuclease subunit